MYVARLALEYTKGNQQKAVSDHIREMFLTYLYLVSEFGSLTFPRHIKRADCSEKSTLLAFADSSSTAWMVILYLLKLDHNKKFFTEFLYSNGGLNPINRTIPRNELHSYSKAGEVVENIMEVVSDVVKNKYLIGDNKIAFF